VQASVHCCTQGAENRPAGAPTRGQGNVASGWQEDAISSQPSQRVAAESEVTRGQAASRNDTHLRRIDPYLLICGLFLEMEKRIWRFGENCGLSRWRCLGKKFRRIFRRDHRFAGSNRSTWCRDPRAPQRVCDEPLLYQVGATRRLLNFFGGASERSRRSYPLQNKHSWQCSIHRDLNTMMSLGTLLTIHRSHWSGEGRAKKNCSGDRL